MIKKALTGANSGIGVSFLRLKKPEVVNRWFAGLHDSAAAVALPMQIFTQLKFTSSFPADSLSELFRFIESAFPGEMPSVRNETKLFGTLSPMPVLPQCISAASMKALVGTRLQHARLKIS